MKNKESVEKIKLAWKNKSKEEIDELVQKRNETRIANNSTDKSNNTKKSTILKNIPSDYTPFFKIYDYYDKVNKIPSNKSSITSDICEYLDIKVVLISGVKCVKTKEVNRIYKYIKNKYRSRNNFLGENLIVWYLTKKHIKFETQKMFDECRSQSNRMLVFDFYLLDFNLCIELDGPCLYEINCYYTNEDNLNIRKTRDSIKNEFCKNNNINLIRIPWLMEGINSEGKLIQKLEDELINYIPNIKNVL